MTNEIIDLNRCSIGVTTGSVYVGVIGHEERHEYSFLGPKVCIAPPSGPNNPDNNPIPLMKRSFNMDLGEYGSPYHDGRLYRNGKL